LPSTHVMLMLMWVVSLYEVACRPLELFPGHLLLARRWREWVVAGASQRSGATHRLQVSLAPVDVLVMVVVLLFVFLRKAAAATAAPVKAAITMTIIMVLASAQSKWKVYLSLQS